MNTDTTLTVTFDVVLPNSPPLISQQPTNQIAITGSQVTLNAHVLGAQPMEYQWFKDEQPISDATNAVLTFASVAVTNTGAYSFSATNALGYTNSQPATFTIENLILFTNGQPVIGPSMTAVGQATISIQSLYPSGSIFYTLDGSDPDFNGTQYTGPFAVSATATLKAIAYSADFAQSVLSVPLAITIVPVYYLSTSVPYGAGTINLDPPRNLYTSNTQVTVTATGNPGWTLMNWGRGDHRERPNQCDCHGRAALGHCHLWHNAGRHGCGKRNGLHAPRSPSMSGRRYCGTVGHSRARQLFRPVGQCRKRDSNPALLQRDKPNAERFRSVCRPAGESS